MTAAVASLLSLIVGFAAVSVAAASQSRGRLVVVVAGLPPGQRPSVVVHGPGTNHSLTARRLSLSGLKPGRYAVTMHALRITHAWRSIRTDARVFPKSNRIVVQVRRGRTTAVDATYGTIVNPGVTKLPHGLLAVIGDASSPTGLVFGKRVRVPAVGDVVVAGPSTRLPYGLIAKIKSSGRSGSRRTLSVANVPVSAAVPEFSFSGAIRFRGAARLPGICACRRCTKLLRWVEDVRRWRQPGPVPDQTGLGESVPGRNVGRGCRADD